MKTETLKMLQRFSKRHSLKSLRELNRKDLDLLTLLEAERWVQEQIQERKQELLQIQHDVRHELFDGTRAVIEKRAVTRLAILAEIEELEQLQVEIKYCISPQSLDAEISRRERQQRPQLSATAIMGESGASGR
jgi:hypothetical protein